MKNMTNYKARMMGKKDLKAVFKALRIKDGIGDDEIKSDDFSYWYNKNRDGTIGNYLIYEIVDSEPAHRADDQVYGREFFAQIDVFSVRSFESKELSNFIQKLEEKLVEHRFEVDMQGEEYEQDTRLYRQTLFVTKIYF